MLKKLLYCVCAVVLTTTAMAQNIDKVYMSSGSEYEGYISEQIPGYKIVVTATLATVNMASERISGISTVKKDIAELDPTLQKWMKLNRPNATTLEVSNLKIDGEIEYQDVVILENNGSRVRVLIASEDRYVLDWEDIVKTTKLASASTKFGIKEVVTLRNGKTYEGSIVEQVIGKQLTIKADNGKENIVKAADVASIKTLQRDPQSSLWLQIPLIDEVRLEDGVIKRGFISARNMGTSLEIIPEDQTKAEVIDLAKVSGYRKVLNPKYGANAQKESTEVSAPAAKPAETKPAETKPATTEAPKAAIPAKTTTPKATAPKSGDAATKAADAKAADQKVAEAKPAETAPAQTPAQSKVEEPKPILAPSSGFYVNGKPAVLSKVAIAATKLSFISKTYVVAPSSAMIQVSGKEPIIITLPADFELSDEIFIAKTETREVTLGESDTKTACHTFTRAKAEKSAVGFFTTKRGDAIELKITSIEPGVYALWPIGEAMDRCVMFEVK